MGAHLGEGAAALHRAPLPGAAAISVHVVAGLANPRFLVEIDAIAVV